MMNSLRERGTSPRAALLASRGTDDIATANPSEDLVAGRSELVSGGVQQVAHPGSDVVADQAHAFDAVDAAQ